MIDIRKAVKYFGIFNLVLFISIVFLWISAIWIHGLIGAVSWALLKLVFPVAGFAGLIVFVIIAVVFTIKRRRIFSQIISILLCLILIFPILMTMNVISLGYPIKIAQANPVITIASPLKENAVVAWGGDDIENNLPHVMWASERWAYDLVMEPYNTGNADFEDYGIWDKEVVSPVVGTVIAAYDDEEDFPPNTEDFISAEGNHVYIQIKETGTYLLLNHLKKGSVMVAVGDQVEVGDPIARVGNSGTTSEPHLHIHHQQQNPLKTWFPVLAEGLPLYFEVECRSYMPIKGETLEYNHAK